MDLEATQKQSFFNKRVAPSLPSSAPVLGRQYPLEYLLELMGLWVTHSPRISHVNGLSCRHLGVANLEACLLNLGKCVAYLPIINSVLTPITYYSLIRSPETDPWGKAETAGVTKSRAQGIES